MILKIFIIKLFLNSQEDSFGDMPFHSLHDFVTHHSHHTSGFSAYWQHFVLWFLADFCVPFIVSLMYVSLVCAWLHI